MQNALRCPTCGSAIGRDRTAGQCPSCLLEIVLAGDLGVETPQRVGQYLIIEEIAAGGMGIVYRARQEGLQREVALKVLREGALASREMVRRFQTEAQAAGRLNHPHIVPIYEVGHEQGRHYFTMRLVAGGSIAQALEHGRSFSAENSARIIVRVARAIHYAHERGILHRDLKPGNILLDLDGAPQVSDFGLARVLDSDSSITLPEMILGSPAYMAPEQASGQAGQATTATDIYSLGAVLYELLAGRPPFTGERPIAVLQQVINEAPAPPSKYTPELDRGLEAICLKCLKKKPELRYASARLLAEDLEHWIAGEPISVHALTRFETVLRWGRRHPAVTALSAALALAVIAGVAGIIYQWQQAQDDAFRARQNLYAADMNLAQQELRANNRGRARDLLVAHRPAAGQPDLRGWEWHYLWQESSDDPIKRIGRLDGRVRNLLFAPGSKRLIAGGWMPQIAVFDWPSGNLVAETRMPLQVRDLALGRDGTILYAGLRNGEIYPLDPVTLRSMGPVLKHSFNDQSAWQRGYGLWALSPSKSGEWLASGDFFLSDNSGRVWLHNLRSGIRRLLELPDGSGASCLAFAPGTEDLGIGTGAGKVLLLSPKTGRTTSLASHLFGGGPYSVVSLVWSPDGRWIVSAGTDNSVYVSDTVRGEKVAQLAQDVPTFALAFSPDGKHLATGGADQKVDLWETDTWKRVRELRAQSEISAVTFSLDDSALITGAKDGTIQVWNPYQTNANRSLRQYRFQNSAPVVCSSDGGTAIGGRQPDFILVSTADFSVRTNHIDGVVRHLASPSPRGRYYVIFSAPDEPLKVWDAAAQRTIANLGVAAWKWGGSAFSTKEDLFVIAQTDGTLDLWEVPFRKKRWHLDNALPAVGIWSYAYTFSPSDSQIALGLADGTVRVLETKTGRTLWVLRASAQVVTAVRYTPDESTLFAVGTDGWVTAFSSRNGKELFRLAQTQYDLYSLAIAPDGKTLALGSNKGQVELWNCSMQPPRQVLNLAAGTAPVYYLGFSNDGRDLVAGNIAEIYRWRVRHSSEQ